MIELVSGGRTKPARGVGARCSPISTREEKITRPKMDARTGARRWRSTSYRAPIWCVQARTCRRCAMRWRCISIRSLAVARLALAEAYARQAQAG